MALPEQHVPILTTKLYRPPVTADYVSRESLQARLDAGREMPLTVVSAPAGYGKSTLISGWLEANGHPSAWLSLDEAEGDLRTFLSYLVAAVRTVVPEACPATLSLLGAGDLPPTSVVAAQLGNDLEALEERLILALDDYSRIRGTAVHELLDRLLEHPPRHLHLVLMVRRDPHLSLARLRAGHLVNEIRMRDLRFTDAETRSFVHRATGRSLESDDVGRLQERTEGWPVGLRLAALALRHQEDVKGFLDGFGAGARPVQDYLIGEILSGQSTRMRERLLRTSILNRFGSSVCEAVWGDDGKEGTEPISGREFIETLETSGLLCVSLDERGEWYRFHHLFQEFLANQLEVDLGANVISGLHRRASAWFAEHGLFEEALHHALEGDDVVNAVGIVGRSRHDLMNAEGWHRLETWLRMFPADLVEDQPELLLLRCWLDLHHWYRLDALVRDLDRAEAVLEAAAVDADTAELLGAEVATMRSHLDYWVLEPSRSVERARAVDRRVPRAYECVRSNAAMALAMGHQMLGHVGEAERLLLDSMEMGEYRYPSSQARLLIALCFVHWLEADPSRTRQAGERLLEISSEHDFTWSAAFARYFLGLVHYERDELAAAAEHLEVVVERPHLFPIQNVAHCSFLLSLCHEARGESDRAREVAESIAKVTLERGNRMFFDLATAFQAELALRQGRMAEAGAWARSFEPPAPHAMQRFFNAELTWVKVLMGRDEPRDREAASSELERLRELVLRTHDRRLLIDVLALQALVSAAAGDEAAASSALREAIQVAQPGRLIRPVADLGPGLVPLLNRLRLDEGGLEHVGAILSVVRGGPVRTQPLVEPLSPRELEILDLLARDLSNKEIGERLFISPGTVKRHAHSIYGKLAVSSRRKAVAKATGLGLLRKQ